MKKTYVFLVRTHDGIVVKSKKPADVKLLSSRTWCVWKNGRRSFKYTESIGDNHSRFLYSDNYTGTVGVFDTSKTSHVRALVKSAIANREEQLSYSLVNGVQDVFGRNICLKAVTAQRQSSRQIRRMPSYQSLYLRIESMIHDTCRTVI